MDEFVSPKDAAALLHVSESTVRRMFDSGELRGARTAGGHRKVLGADIQKILDADIISYSEEAVAPDADTISYPQEK